jgi:hypothetical protein
MKPLPAAAVSVGLALVSFFQFPGHTWLQQDSQIYVPILENLRDSAALRNDLLVQRPHVAFTLYDETALLQRRATGFGFREVLAAQQIVTRALGIWGLWMIALSLGLPGGPALLVAAICALGALIAGPEVLTFEYEPTPRAFALPLVMCAMGLAAHRRYTASAVAAGAAFLYHPLTALPFWIVFLVLVAVRRRLSSALPLAAAAAVLTIAARLQGAGGQIIWGRLSGLEQQVDRLRAAYVWISTWPVRTALQYLIAFAILSAAALRLRKAFSADTRILLLGLPLLGLLSMPVSWLLLDQWKWGLLPQVQPLRTLLFVILSMQILTAAAGAHAAAHGSYFEAFGWFSLAFLPAMYAHLSAAAFVVVVALGALAAAAVRYAPPFSPGIALAACFALPAFGGIVNYPHLHTPELAELSAFARSSTPRDAVFLFADGGHSLDSGIFRSEALRAVYVDWKSGGQVNYLKGFAEEWWFRWQQTIGGGFRVTDLPRYDGLGITYLILQPAHRLPRAPAFENSRYVAYSVR